MPWAMAHCFSSPPSRLFHDQPLQRFGHKADLVDREPAFVTSLPAIFATYATLKNRAFFEGEADFLEILFRIIDRLDAIRTDGADEALGEERFHDRGEEERLNVHVDETRNAADRVVCVQGAKDKVTGHRGADRDVGGLDVANFSHHDDVRVLAQDVAQTFGEGEVDLRFHIDLRNAGEAIFNRFLDRDDAALDGVDAAEETIERGRFSGTGRTGDENDAVRLGEERLHDPGLLRAEVEPFKAE